MLPQSADADDPDANYRSVCSLETERDGPCGEIFHMTDAGAMVRKRVHERQTNCTVEVEEVD